MSVRVLNWLYLGHFIFYQLLMEDYHEPGDTSNTENQSLNPLFSIWLHPARTIRYLVDVAPRKYVIPLFAVAGIQQLLFMCYIFKTGDYYTADQLLQMIPVGGMFGGIVSGFIGSALFYFAGRAWLDGSATFRQVAIVFAWSHLPLIFILGFWLIKLGVLGGALLTSKGVVFEERTAVWWGLSAIDVITGLLNAWRLIILMHGLAEVHRFSPVKGLLNIVLAAGTAIIALFFILLLLVSIFGEQLLQLKTLQ